MSRAKTGAAAEAVTAQSAAALADLHDRCFATGWGESEFAAMLQLPGMTGLVTGPPTAPTGLILVRAAADEAEVLTVCVDPDARGQGLGHCLLQGAETRLESAGIVRLFLEVSTENMRARRLYDQAGYSEIGRRRRYYADGADACVLEKWLSGDGHHPA